MIMGILVGLYLGIATKLYWICLLSILLGIFTLALMHLHPIIGFMILFGAIIVEIIQLRLDRI